MSEAANALAEALTKCEPTRMCGADHGDACDCLGSDPCTCGGGHTNVDGNGGHALGCPARAVTSICHTSPDAQADAQTPHNAMVRDDTTLVEALQEILDRATTHASDAAARPDIAAIARSALAAAVPEAGKDTG